MRVAARFCWLTIAFVASQAAHSGPTRADDQPAAEATGDVAATKIEVQPGVPRTSAKVRGRLPAYYSKVVNPAQRAKIYSIQADYNEKIQQLESDLRELKSKRDAEIRAVLTPTQKRKLDALIAAARAKKLGVAPVAEPAVPATEDTVDVDIPAE